MPASGVILHRNANRYQYTIPYSVRNYILYLPPVIGIGLYLGAYTYIIL